MGAEYPVLSLRERDRRWRRVRALMKEKGVECLILAGLKSREQLEGYLTNEYLEGIVIFPLDGDPVCLTWTGSRVTRHTENIQSANQPWVEDIRVGTSGQSIAAILKEKGFDRARIGVVGLESRAPGEGSGYIPYNTWVRVLEELKSATFVDLSFAFSELVLVKSEEELDLVPSSAKVGEKASEAMLRYMKPGISERALYAEIMKTIFENGASVRYPLLILVTGADNISWGPPIWHYQAQPPRILQAGDLAQAEIFPVYGGMETQQQMTVSLKPVHPINAEMAKVARKSY